MKLKKEGPPSDLINISFSSIKKGKAGLLKGEKLFYLQSQLWTELFPIQKEESFQEALGRKKAPLPDQFLEG